MGILFDGKTVSPHIAWDDGTSGFVSIIGEIGSFRVFTSSGGGALTSSNERFKVDSSGSVGIGTTSPYAKLSVTNTGSAPSFIVEDSTSPDSTPFIIDASGNVGIGTSIPTASLNIRSTATISHDVVKLDWEHLNSSQNIEQRISSYFGDNATPNNFNQAGYVAFGKEGQWGSSGTRDVYLALGLSLDSVLAEKARITSQGNLGIGTTTPYAKLSIAGSSLGTTNLFAISTSTASATSTAFEVTSQGQVKINNAVPYYGTGGNTAVACYMSDGSLGHITITSLLASGNCVGN